LLAIAGLYGSVIGWASFSYRRFLYPVPAVAVPLPPGVGTLHQLTASDGVTTHALELPARPGARTIVHFHGNGETIGDNVELARQLSNRGFGVVLAEYRGYGLSAGAAPTEQGLYRDAEAVLDMLERRGVGPAKIILWGMSLGSGVAAEMARRKRGSGLVLFAPYTSIPRAAAAVIPILPMSLIFRDKFDTLSKAPAIDVATLIVHGERDAVIPFAMGRQLATAFRQARLVAVPGGHHNDLWMLDGPRLLEEVVDFAARL
jgi:alpha-beta hydrolase superfamily lysophospholipase